MEDTNWHISNGKIGTTVNLEQSSMKIVNLGQLRNDKVRSFFVGGTVRKCRYALLSIHIVNTLSLALLFSCLAIYNVHYCAGKEKRFLTFIVVFFFILFVNVIEKKKDIS